MAAGLLHAPAAQAYTRGAVLEPVAIAQESFAPQLTLSSLRTAFAEPLPNPFLDVDLGNWVVSADPGALLTAAPLQASPLARSGEAETVDRAEHTGSIGQPGPATEEKPAATTALSLALRRFAIRRAAARHDPFPEQFTPQPLTIALAPPLPSERPVVAPPGAKNARRRMPQAAAWMPTPRAEPRRGTSTADETPTPKLGPEFTRIRLLAKPVVADARTLVTADGFRIRLVGIDLPLADAVCARLDGERESCRTRAATLLELTIRGRQLVCRYQQPDIAGIAYGHCRAGGADVADGIARRGYARRTALAPPAFAPPVADVAVEEAPVVSRPAPPARRDRPFAEPKREPSPRLVRVLAPAPRAGLPRVVTAAPPPAAGPAFLSVTPRPARARAARAPREQVHRLDQPRFIRFADRAN